MKIKTHGKILRNRSALTLTPKHIDCCSGNGVYSAKRECCVSEWGSKGNWLKSKNKPVFHLGCVLQNIAENEIIVIMTYHPSVLTKI